MAREIKFRAWDIPVKLMLENVGFEAGAIESRKDLIFMQYTGLKDKNGKEIYEGDIVCSLNDTPKINAVVKWQDGRFILKNWFDVYGQEPDFKIVDPSQVEVIGNIYENPMLIKQPETA